MRKVAVSLYDESGNMLRDWAEAGYECYAFDLLNTGKVEQIGPGSITYVKADLFDPAFRDYIKQLQPSILFGFPPCTDLAVSGARHFESKLKADPDCHVKAMRLVKLVPELGNELGIPWMFENPVSIISKLWRTPNFKFHPHQYGGYLPEDDEHPRWPEYIEARDAYSKLTCIWCGNGFKKPPMRGVEYQKGYSLQHTQLGGKSAKTKQIRSETPRGFARAVFLANSIKG